MFFEKSKELFNNKLNEEEKIYLNIMNEIKSNLNKLKKSIKILIEKWKNKIKLNYTVEESSFEAIKGYLRDCIKQKLNLEMNYTHDSNFCLWAIKNGFAQYFTN